MHLKDCLDEYIYDCECRHLSKQTLRNYRGQIVFLVNHLEGLGIYDVEDVRPHHIRSFLQIKQDAGRKPAYINDLLKAFKTFFNYLEQEGYIESSPATKVKNVRQP